ncbi:hypothetical protein PVL29_013783 [Vitis rotundifolia]|uniref:Dynamin N-terminal domain-containing protein n=1 Tax=Vitis rotundifolia TaxID=103349 RepID=A0AA39DPS7_VITRO|nr:hypothetical protein PVL29_013783 [Vitis rotundifolia]
MRQTTALLTDEDVDENSSSSSSRRVLNNLIGHPILPTGENGATRAPICIDLQKDGSLSSKSIILQIDDKSQQVFATFKIAKEYDGGGTEHGRSSYCYGQCTLQFSHPWNLDSLEDGQRIWSSWTLLAKLLFLSTL